MKKTPNNVNKILLVLTFIFPIITFFSLLYKPTRNVILSFVSYFKNLEKKNNMKGNVIYVSFVILINLIFQGSTIPNVASGYIYGLKIGGLLTVTGCILSSIITFYIGRYVLKDSILGELKKYKWFENIYKKQDKLKTMDWFKLVLLTRTAPNYPFHVISYMWGITDVNIITYIVGTTLGTLPVTFFETYIGTKLKNPKEIFHVNNIKILTAFIIISVSVTFIIQKQLKKISDNL